jgi:peptide deformylase
LTVQTILTAPNPLLKRTAKQVVDVHLVQDLIADMLETLYDTPHGVGLAAMQIGRLESVIVIDISPNRDAPLVLINPELILGEGQVTSEEGCLSLPDFNAYAKRYAEVEVMGLDATGQPLHFEAAGFLAIVLQHEMDHLRGVILSDHAEPLVPLHVGQSTSKLS